jgi:hypothetical protein
MRAKFQFLILALWCGAGFSTDVFGATLSAPVVTSITSTSGVVEIKWTTVAGATGYEAQVRRGEAGNWDSIGTAGAKYTSIRTTGLLLLDTNYARVRAFTISESSEFSAAVPFPFNTALRPPSVPDGFRIVNVSWREITVAWDLTERAGGYALGVRDSASPVASYIDLGFNETNYTIRLLQPSTDYYLTILARGNGLGDSSLSPELKVTTKPQPPAASTAVLMAVATNLTGNWPEHFGAEGYAVAGGSTWLAQVPSLTFSPGVYVWDLPASRDSAPVQEPGRSVRVAGAFDFFGTSPLRISAQQPVRVTFYFLDWKSYHRSEVLRLVDEATERVVCATPISAFEDGVYLTFVIQGIVHAEFRSPNGAVWYGSPLLAGLFFGGPVKTAVPVLTLRSAGSLFCLNIAGPAGVTYSLEKSKDLGNWLPRSTGKLDIPEVDVTLDPVETGERGFFRARFDYPSATISAGQQNAQPNRLKLQPGDR